MIKKGQLLENIMVMHLVNIFAGFTMPEDSKPRIQKPDVGPCPNFLNNLLRRT
jgi:hypothetical protein